MEASVANALAWSTTSLAILHVELLQQIIGIFILRDENARGSTATIPRK